MTNAPEPKRKPRKSARPSDTERDGEEGPEVPVGVGASINGTSGADTESEMPLKPR
jgi:hypothetical protein